MLDNLKDLFKEGLQYTHVAGVLQQIANLTNIVHAQYMKDGSDAKNTAIDLICEVLQNHKDTVVPVLNQPTELPVELPVELEPAQPAEAEKNASN